MNLDVAQVDECVFLVVWGIINPDSQYQGGLGFGNRYGPSCFKGKKSAAKTKSTGNLPCRKASRPKESVRSSKTVATSGRAAAHIGRVTLLLYTNSLLDHEKGRFFYSTYLRAKPRSACHKQITK